MSDFWTLENPPPPAAWLALLEAKQAQLELVLACLDSPAARVERGEP